MTRLTHTFAFSPETLAASLADLAETAQQCVDASIPYAVGNISTLVANLIASSGPMGSTAQRNVMDQALVAGFSPQYTGGTGILVEFIPKKKKAAKKAAAKKAAAKKKVAA